MDKTKMTDAGWNMCSEAAKKVIETLNEQLNILHNSQQELPPFNDAVMVIMAIFSSYGLLKLKSMSTNNKDEEIKALFTHYCQSVFDLVNRDYWEFDYEH